MNGKKLLKNAAKIRTKSACKILMEIRRSIYKEYADMENLDKFSLQPNKKKHTGAVLYDIFRFIKGLSVKG